MADLRPRSSSELLDAVFEIYRRHFLILMAVSVFTAVFTAIASYMTDRSVAAVSLASVYNSLLVRFAGIFVAPFTYGAVAYTASAAYLGKPVELGDAVHAVFVHPLRLMFTMVYVALLTALGLLLFIVPGLFVFKRYFAVLMVLLFEDRGIRESLKRSHELSNGNGRQIFGLIGAVLVFVAIASAFLVGAAAPLLHGLPLEVAGLVIYTLGTPFATIAATVLYYDIRIRREGYDIELMTRDLDAAPLALHPSI